MSSASSNGMDSPRDWSAGSVDGANCSPLISRDLATRKSRSRATRLFSSIFPYPIDDADDTIIIARYSDFNCA